MATDRKHAIRGPGKMLYVATQDGGPVKIGISKNPEGRVGRLDTSTPGGDVTLVDTIEIADGHSPNLVENHVHEMLDDDRVTGEWFDVDVDLAVETARESVDGYVSSNDPVNAPGGDDDAEDFGLDVDCSSPGVWLFKVVSALNGKGELASKSKVASLFPSWRDGRVGIYLDEMHDRGVLKKEVVSDGKPGKPPHCFEINESFVEFAEECVERGLFDDLDGVIEKKLEGFDVDRY